MGLNHHTKTRSRRVATSVIAVSLAVLWIGGTTIGQDVDPAVEFQPGLIAEYSYESKGEKLRRIEHAITIDEKSKATDLTVRWSGRLFVRYENRFEIRPHGCGDVTISLGGKEVFAARNSKVAWFDPTFVELDYGWHPIEITYRSLGDVQRFGLFWSSDRFLTEPITSWFHLPSDESDLPDNWEIGRRHVREMGCVHCHVIPGAGEAMAAPPLNELPGNIYGAWLAQYLESDDHGKSTRAPDLGLNRSQAIAIAAALLQKEQPSIRKNNDEGDAQKGEELFHSIGCLACHSFRGIGDAQSNGGGESDRNLAASGLGPFYCAG